MELSYLNSILIDSYQKGYRVIDGKIFNSKHQQLKPHINNNGYPQIRVWINGKNKPLMLHRLLAYQKFGDIIFQKGIQVRHLNGNKLDCSFSNIQIGTQLDNRMDIPIEKRKEMAHKSALAKRKLSKEQADQIRKDYLSCEKKFGFITKMSKIYNTSTSLIYQIITNKSYLQ